LCAAVKPLLAASAAREEAIECRPLAAGWKFPAAGPSSNFKVNVTVFYCDHHPTCESSQGVKVAENAVARKRK